MMQGLDFVNFYMRWLALIVLVGSAPLHSASAVNALPPEKAAADTKSTEQITPSKAAIAPHRAVYNMSLTSVKNGSNITGVSGRMLFEWSDACDGWAVQQHLKLHFNYAEGDDSDVTSTEVTWEAKDGKHYNFNIRRVTDGKETENFRGKAAMDDKGGTVIYSMPANKTATLPADTVFPSAHTRMILDAATSGEKLFSRRVFDGTDEDGSNDVSVFIKPQKANWQQTEANAKLKSNPFLDLPDWPVRMAFYKINTESGEPDYEMNLDLLSNGVAKSMQIDYGDFSVTGTLMDVEALPPSGC